MTADRRLCARVPLAAALVCAGAFIRPIPVEAHLVTTGLGPVYDGISHLLTNPADLLPVLALSMLGGLNGPASGRFTLFALPLAWLAGCVAGVASRSVVTENATISSLLVLGALVAADRRLPTSVVTALAIAVGLVHGYVNGGTIGAANALDALGVVGICSTVFTVVALVGALVVSLSGAWGRIAVRVAGSWIAAVGLLMLGWSLRGIGV